MRTLLVLALLWAIPAFGFQPSENGPLAQRMIVIDGSVRAPKGRLTDETGNTHRLSGYKNEVSVVTLWATWCHVCRKEMPKLAELARQREGTRIKVRPVTVDEPNVRTQYIARHMEVTGIDNLPLLRDLKREVWDRVGARGTPTTLIIDRFGQVVAAVAGGGLDWTHPEVLAYLDALAAAPDRETSRTLLAGG